MLERLAADDVYQRPALIDAASWNRCTEACTLQPGGHRQVAGKLHDAIQGENRPLICWGIPQSDQGQTCAVVQCDQLVPQDTAKQPTPAPPQRPLPPVCVDDLPIPEVKAQAISLEPKQCNSKELPSLPVESIMQRTMAAFEDLKALVDQSQPLLDMMFEADQGESLMDEQSKLQEHSKFQTRGAAQAPVGLKTDPDNYKSTGSRFSSAGKQKKRSTKSQRPPATGPVADFVRGRRFELLCAVVITANGLFIGISSDYAMNHLEQRKISWVVAFEAFFCVFYVIEVVLRMRVQGRSYFYEPEGDNWRWNLFDVFLVVVSIYDQFDNFGLMASNVANMSFLRIMRLLKMMKLLRMVRLMRMFRELRLILNSVMGSMKSMMWSLLLMSTIAYIFGICFLQACTKALQEGNLSQKSVSAITEYWCSVEKSMLSLYMASTGGQDWAAIAQPLEEVGGVFYFLFLIYIAFFLFVVTNTLTSLFVEMTMASSDQDQQMTIQLQLEKQGEYVARMQQMYDEMDEDEDGLISYEEFIKHIDQPEMVAFTSNLDIDVNEAREFFLVLSNHGNRPVNLETFVEGCIKLKGLAKSMDLMDLVYLHRESSKNQEEFAGKCLQRLDDIEQKLSRQRRFPRLDARVA